MEKKTGVVMRHAGMIACLALCCTLTAAAQATKRNQTPLFDQSLQSSFVVADELKHFMLTHVPKLPAATNADDWTKQAEELRAHELGVIYHGWPQEWVNSKPKFEQVAVIERPGYRVVKLLEMARESSAKGCTLKVSF